MTTDPLDPQEKPWWFPQITDDAWIARTRADYPEDTDCMDDEEVRDEYADGMKYADTWDHVGDARDAYEPLADAYLGALSELTSLREKARAADMFQQLVVGEGAWERFSELNTRAESAEARLRELEARVMGAVVVKVDGVIRYADGSVSVLTNPKLTDPVLRPLMGQRVRLVVEGGEDE